MLKTYQVNFTLKKDDQIILESHGHIFIDEEGQEKKESWIITWDNINDELPRMNKMFGWHSLFVKNCRKGRKLYYTAWDSTPLIAKEWKDKSLYLLLTATTSLKKVDLETVRRLPDSEKVIQYFKERLVPVEVMIDDRR